jgi:hypothetical protein
MRSMATVHHSIGQEGCSHAQSGLMKEGRHVAILASHKPANCMTIQDLQCFHFLLTPWTLAKTPLRPPRAPPSSAGPVTSQDSVLGSRQHSRSNPSFPACIQSSKAFEAVAYNSSPPSIALLPSYCHFVVCCQLPERV